MKKIRAFLIGVTVVYLILISAFAAFRTLEEVLTNPNFDSTALSNVGFVILMALANVCFSWGRIFTTENDKRLANKLNSQATHSAIAAILFAIGSLTKYAMLHGSQILFSQAYKNALYLACIIAFVLALFYTFYVIFSILLVYQTIIREKFKIKRILL